MKKLVPILFLLISLAGFAQIKNIGTPNVYNYPKSVYKAGTQNWGITQDENGFMYFANNEGVLIFNGLHWEHVKVSQTKPIRSVFADADNTIYIGLLNDFGFLQQDVKGLLKFKSLRDLLPEDIEDFEDIWRIYRISEGIAFQTFEYLFIFNNEEVKVIKPKQRFHFSFNVNGKLFLHEPGFGVYEYFNNYIKKAPWSDELKYKDISEILYIRDDYYLICTSNSGIYKLENGILEKWNAPVNALVEEYKLYSAKSILRDYLAFGTILNGLIITDIDGNILQHLNSNNGLQNNTVLSLFYSRNGNLWAGLDNGIDFIELNSPLSYFSDFKEIGTGYCAQIFDNKLYLGTNQGLFVKEFSEFSHSDEEFELVKNTAGQVWSLSVFDDQLICGHNSGTFVIKNREATLICDEEGAWKYIRLKNKPDFILGGHYSGLVLLRNGKDGWEYYKKVTGFDESCRFLRQFKDEEIWVSHGAQGVFKISMNRTMDSVENYKLYNALNGLPSDENNIVFSLSDGIFVSTLKGIYQYDKNTDNFQISEKLNHIFDIDSRLKTIEKDDEGNFWFIAQNESGVLRSNEDSTYTKISLPFKQLDGKYVNEFEFIYPYSNDHVFTGIDNGFAHYSASITKSYTRPFQSYIASVELPNIDSVINFPFIINPELQFVFPFHKNSFRFYFTAPFYENLQQLKFSYFLDNYSEEWSDWTYDSFKDITNLPEGKYGFKVKAKNIYGVESEESFFNFSIAPPWYRTRFAYIVYGILFLIIVFAVFKYNRYRIKQSKRKQQQKHAAEMQSKEKQFKHESVMAEKEIIRLRNDKLRAEMVHRDKELANQTMSIIQKNAFLSKLKVELIQIRKATENPQLTNKLKSIGKRLEREIDNKQQYEVFKTYFEEVHEDFFKRIKEKHPQLSPRELHLSAYIRMNLTTKEIAALLNITDRGVEISRYRLRKKLELTRKDNLSVYLANI